LVAVIVAAEWYELRFGGVVVVPLLAVYVLFDYFDTHADRDPGPNTD
jgi:hypothetical protein